VPPSVDARDRSRARAPQSGVFPMYRAAARIALPNVPTKFFAYLGLLVSRRSARDRTRRRSRSSRRRATALQPLREQLERIHIAYPPNGRFHSNIDSSSASASSVRSSTLLRPHYSPWAALFYSGGAARAGHPAEHCVVRWRSRGAEAQRGHRDTISGARPSLAASRATHIADANRCRAGAIGRSLTPPHTGTAELRRSPHDCPQSRVLRQVAVRDQRDDHEARGRDLVRARGDQLSRSAGRALDYVYAASRPIPPSVNTAAAIPANTRADPQDP